jgi:hypothetical protein
MIEIQVEGSGTELENVTLSITGCGTPIALSAVRFTQGIVPFLPRFCD